MRAPFNPSILSLPHALCGVQRRQNRGVLFADMFKIKQWNERYENNRSRTVADLRWVPIPNSHDGEGFATIMAHKDAAEIYTAWILMLQVASRCHPRGSLVRSDGTCLSVASLAIRTRAKREWFEKAIPALLQVGWIERLTDQTSPAWQATDTQLTPDCQAGDEEGKGKKERKRRESTAAMPPTLSEISLFCHANGLTHADAEATFHKWEANKFTNNGRPIKNWEATIRAWKASGFMPSQKKQVNGTPALPGLTSRPLN
jgi:hypothetical protein